MVVSAITPMIMDIMDITITGAAIITIPITIMAAVITTVAMLTAGQHILRAHHLLSMRAFPGAVADIRAVVGAAAEGMVAVGVTKTVRQRPS